MGIIVKWKTSIKCLKLTFLEIAQKNWGFLRGDY